MKNSRHQTQSFTRNDERLAKGLGWFSIGLGLAELLAPRALARLIGVRSRPLLFGALGLREIISGIGILTNRRPVVSMWSRVAGDAMDLSLLGTALASDDTDHGRVEAATAAVVGVTILDAVCATRLTSSGGRKTPLHFTRSLTIDRSPEELYGFWRNFENLPKIMEFVESVQNTAPGRSHWVVKSPMGTRVEWEAEIVQDRANELIAWRSLEGDVFSSGSVRFEPATAGRGTVVRVQVEYRPPGGILGALAAKLFRRAPEQEIQADLHRFKQIMETGQIISTEGQPAGRSRSTSRIYDDLIRHGM